MSIESYLIIANITYKYEKSPFPGEILCVAWPDGPASGCYLTSRLVAVSGKITHGRNCLASSKSISA